MSVVQLGAGPANSLLNRRATRVSGRVKEAMFACAVGDHLCPDRRRHHRRPPPSGTGPATSSGRTLRLLDAGGVKAEMSIPLVSLHLTLKSLNPSDLGQLEAVALVSAFTGFIGPNSP